MLKKTTKTVFVQYTKDKIALIKIIYFGGKFVVMQPTGTLICDVIVCHFTPI